MPNYTDLGFSAVMGAQLREIVEIQLTVDLKNYGVEKSNVKFDWSNSCIEGHRTDYLAGSLENFSGIAVFDEHDNLIGDGWIEFIHEGDFFSVYWDCITTRDEDRNIGKKEQFGIPNHVWQQIPDNIRPRYLSKKLKLNPFLRQ